MPASEHGAHTTNAEYRLQQLRTGAPNEIVEAIRELEDFSATDKKGNTALHVILLNRYITRNPRLAELVISALVVEGAGVNLETRNDNGQTPRELAEHIRSADNIRPEEYGALGVAIWQLEKFEDAHAQQQSRHDAGQGRDSKQCGEAIAEIEEQFCDLATPAERHARHVLASRQRASGERER